MGAGLMDDQERALTLSTIASGIQVLRDARDAALVDLIGLSDLQATTTALGASVEALEPGPLRDVLAQIVEVLAETHARRADMDMAVAVSLDAAVGVTRWLSGVNQ